MKKCVLSLALLTIAFLGRSQVILNEMFTSSNGTNQFIELYNVGIDPVDLSCYRIVSFGISNGNPQRVTTINIIDFPDGALIPSKGYYTLGEGATIQSKSMNYNWNAAATGASFKTYTVNNGNNTITGPSNGSGDFILEATGNTKLAVFLFDGSAAATDANGNIAYVNGLVAYGSLTTPTPNPPLPGVPSSFNLANLPVLDVTGTTCATAKIDWKRLTTSEYSEAASGNNHGYERLANGLCGTWQKITSGYTPNSRNRLGNTTTSTSGTITATETALCNGVAYSITDYTDAVYPLTLQLYYDDGDGVLEDGEEREVIATINTLPASGQHTFTTALPAGSVPVIAYKTPFGCFSRVFKASNTATLVTNQYNICNQQAAFSITNADALTSTYGFPVTVSFLYDGAPFGDPVTITEPSSAIYYSNLFVDPTKLSIQYTPANCLSAITVSNATSSSFTAATGSLTTEEQLIKQTSSNYPARVSVDVTDITSSINPHTTEVFPIEVRMYIDNDPSNATPDTAAALYPDSYLGSVSFNSLTEDAKTFSATNQEFTADDQGKTIYLVYKPTLSCFGKTVPLTLPDAIALPVTFKSFTATRKEQTVLLQWQTASEVDNKGFQVQRNRGDGWKDIAFVRSQADNGNSSTILTYQYSDANAAKGISQYRLLQVDIDGKGKLSEIRSVRGAEQASKLLVYPNPSTSGTINVVFDNTHAKNVTISDMSGRIVKQYKNVSGQLVIENLAEGYFTLQVADLQTNATAVEKIIVKRQ